MELKEERISGERVYEGVIVNVRMDQARLVDGRVTRREVVEHPGGVCVLPVDGEGNALCVRQYRYPMGEHLLEAPAGKLEWGEEPLACAVRELSEETGCTAGRLIPLGKYYTSPGYSTECLHLYLALDLERGEAHLDEGEFLDVVRMPLSQLYDMTARGEIRDGKTAIAVLQAWRILRSQQG